MMKYAIYAVISPEGCASILWKSAEKAEEAAEAMRITSASLDDLGVIDEIIDEPLGGATATLMPRHQNLLRLLNQPSRIYP